MFLLLMAQKLINLLVLNWSYLWIKKNEKIFNLLQIIFKSNQKNLSKKMSINKLRQL